MTLKSTQVVRPVTGPLPGSQVALPGLAELFGEDAEVRQLFRREASRVLLPGGHELFTEGDPADKLYLLVHGRLQVVLRRPDGGRQVVGEVAAGEICGERSLLLGAPRSATVRAVRDSELLELDRDGVDRLIAKHPQAVLHVARTLISRLSPVGGEMPGCAAISTVALVPLHPSVPLGRLAQGLAQALASFGSVAHLTAAVVDDAIGEGMAESSFGDGEGKVTSWLHKREASHRFVVYEADQTLTSWSRRCIRQADRVLLVAEAGSDPEPGPADEYLAHRLATGQAADRELVLLRRERCARCAAPWLRGRSVLKGHHHVDLDEVGTVDRLARILAGRAVGLVLSGGGARTLAHIGAIRAIREAGLTIDRIGGVSGGAIFAGQLALGWDDATIEAQTRRLLVDDGSLLDFSLPVISLIRGRKWRAALMEMFGETRIEDLDRPFFCVSTNLSRGELAVHREGLMWRWVRASLSVPGLAPPLVEDGELYVDGSVLNNLPIDVMRDAGAGPVLAVSVASERGPAIEKDVDRVPSRWSALKARLAGGDGAPEIPSIVDILVGATMVSGRRSSVVFEPMADLVIRAECGDVGHLEFSAMDQLVAAGYEAATEALEGWTPTPAAERYDGSP